MLPTTIALGQRAVQIFAVNAFTEQPFAGNPAAVCLLSDTKSDVWLQAVARELNLSETAFLLPLAESHYHLRWFTPTVEVDLCGHATLASAHVLWHYGGVAADLRFSTRSGILGATYDQGWIWLDFPVQPVAAIEAPAALITALGVMPRWVGRNATNYLVELATAAQVRDLVPDLVAIAKGRSETIASLDAQGIIVTAKAEPPYAFVSRYFAPAVGVNEDPVTGSTHCSLVDYWQVGAEPVLAAQVSARGGVLQVARRGDRVAIGGQAVTVWQGALLV